MCIDQIWKVIADKHPAIPQKYHLSTEHEQELALSGISKEDACYAGIFTATSQQAMDLVGYESPGLVFLYFTEDDELVTYKTKSRGKNVFARLKPDGNGKSRYLSPADSGCKIYLPRCRDLDWINDHGKFVSDDLMLTEGEKKALSNCLHTRFPTMGLGGINSYRTSTMGKSLGFLEEHCNLSQMKSVTLAPDSDIVHNDNVRSGCDTMIENIFDNYIRKSVSQAKALSQKFNYILIPSLDGEKTGIDDLIYKVGGEQVEKLFKSKLKAGLLTEDRKTNDLKPESLIVAEPLGDGSKKTKKADQLNTAHSLRVTMIEMSMIDKFRHCDARGWMEYDEQQRIYVPLGKGTKIEFVISRIADLYKWNNRETKIVANMIAEITERRLTTFTEWDVIDKIVFANGIYDTQTKEFTTAGDPSLLLSISLPYNYDPEAECPEFEKWLEYTYSDPVGDEWEPNKYRIKYVKCLLRFFLTKMADFASPVEKALIVCGNPGTSKGTFLEVVNNLIGNGAVGQWTPKLLTSINHLSSMAGKKVSICYDMKGKLDSDACGQFTQIVSNEPVGIKRLWKDQVSVRLCTHLIAASNEFHFGDSASVEGLTRRTAMLQHKRKPEVKDPDLKKRLVEECSGIWNMIMKIDLDDAIDYINRYSVSDDSLESLTERALKNNTIYNWMQNAPSTEWCMCEHGQMISLHLHYSRYQNWTRDCRLEPLTSVQFEDELRMLECDFLKHLDERTGRTATAVLIPPLSQIDRKVLLRL